MNEDFKKVGLNKGKMPQGNYSQKKTDAKPKAENKDKKY